MIRHSNEFLIDNNLDAAFRKMLFPLNLMLFVLLQPKYRILQGFVTPNGIYANLMCIMAIFILTAIHGCQLLYQVNVVSLLRISSTISVSFVLDVTFIAVFYVIVCLLNVTQSENNVKLILHLQQVYRVTECKDIKLFEKQNWILVIMIFSFYLVVIIICTIIGIESVNLMLFTLSIMYFDANLIFYTGIIKFLIHELKLWTMQMDRFYVFCSETDHTQLRQYFNEVRQRERKLLGGFIAILEAFKLCENVFQKLILLQATDVFVHSLMYIQIFIEINKASEFFKDISLLNIAIILMSLIWVIKNLVLISNICMSCEQYYSAVAEVDAASAVMLSKESSLAVRRLCKNVSRLSACARSGRGLRTRGALAVDAALPLRLLALLVTYTAVLLQFAFN